jgi:hypothetical protein
MALTTAQKIQLNRVLAQYPSSASNPTMLADMWEAVSAPALKSAYKTEVLAKINALQTQTDAPFAAALDAINNSSSS